MNRPLLILVHVEDHFRRYFPDKMYVPRIVKAANRYDTIHFTSHVVDDTPIREIRPLLQQEFYWGWGHEPEQFEDTDDEPWVIPSRSPHQWTLVPAELRPLKGIKREILLGGGCDGECLTNMEECLTFLELPYRKVDGYVYKFIQR